MADYIEWKQFKIDPVLFKAGQFDDVLAAFRAEWDRVNNPACSAIFKDPQAADIYYISTKEPAILSRISRVVALQDCLPPSGERVQWLAGHRPSVGK